MNLILKRYIVVLFFITVPMVSCQDKKLNFSAIEIFWDSIKVEVYLNKVVYNKEINSSFVYGKIKATGFSFNVETTDMDCYQIKLNDLPSDGIYTDTQMSVINLVHLKKKGFERSVYWYFRGVNFSDIDLSNLTLFNLNKKYRECNSIRLDHQGVSQLDF